MTEQEIKLIERLVDVKIESNFQQFGARAGWEIWDEIEQIKKELKSINQP